MSLITPDFGLIFWMTLIFCVVLLILAKFGFPVITDRVAKRQERINDSIRLASEAEARFAELEEKQKQMLEQARIEQGRILKEAAEAKDEIIGQAREEAREEASRILEDARGKLAVEREEMMREIQSQVAMLSVQVAGKVLRKELSESSEQQAFIERMVDEFTRTGIDS